MNKENIAENIEKMTIGLDDTFKFHCTQCGLCCIHRDDIILSPVDIYKMAKELNMMPQVFFAQYCQSHIGDTSRMPVVMLRPVGDDLRCPLLQNHKCSVHKVKPAVCALFPLGRYAVVDSKTYSENGIGNSEVKYLLQPVDCGDTTETHTVREWLGGFDIKLEDEAFIRWHQVIARVSTTIKELEKKWDMITMMQIWFMVRVTLYEHYDISRPFLPQFEENAAFVFRMLQDIPRLKELME